jgi:protoheme IX farnesyltransferase
VLAASAACLRLSKAGLVAMVAGAGGAGYVLAGGRAVDIRLLWTVAGTGLLAAGANAFNQWWEIQLDSVMQRTCGRPLPARQLAPVSALCWAAAASVAGVVVLAAGATVLAAGVGLGAAVLYVLVYTPLKRRTTLCTLAGAVCGAAPLPLGWAAARGSLDYAAWLLAALLFAWQIPHALAIAWLRRQDIERAGFRILAFRGDPGRAASQMCLLYSLALAPLSLLAATAGVAGWRGAALAALVAGGLTLHSLRFCLRRDDASARAVFRYSLSCLPLMLLAMMAV